MKHFVLATIVIGAISVQAVTFRQDFYRDYKEHRAMGLLNGRRHNYAEAQAAFADLAKTAVTSAEKSKWTAWEAIALGRQKDQRDPAMKLAESAGPGPGPGAYAKYARMEIMGQYKEWESLVKTYKDENLAAWPEDIKEPALLLRGRAFAMVKDYAKAVGDFENALVMQDPKQYDWIQTIGSIAYYHGQNGDDAKALATYQRIFDMAKKHEPVWARSSYHSRAKMSAAKILENQGKLNEALTILTERDFIDRSTGGAIREVTGDILAKMGKTKEALTKYQEALEFTAKLDKRYQRRDNHVKKKIEELKKTEGTPKK